MRSAKTPLSSKIPGKTGIPPSNGGARNLAGPSPTAQSGVGMPASRLPLGPNPIAQPKFTPFKKAAAAPEEARQDQDDAPPLRENKDAPLGVTAAALSSGSSNDVEADRAERAPAAEDPMPDASPQGSCCGSSTTVPPEPTPAGARHPTNDAPAEVKLAVAFNAAASAVNIVAASNTGVVVGAAAAAAACKPPEKERAAVPVSNTVAKSSQKRMEELLVKAGVASDKPDALKALAASVLEALKAEAAATSSSWPSKVNAAATALCLVGLGALALCVAWLVWVLVDKNIVGGPMLSEVGYFS